MQHYLIEAFTRCVSMLYFIVVPKEMRQEVEGRGNCGQILNKWHSKNLVRKLIVTSCNYHKPEDDGSSTFCKKKGKYRVHVWHNDFAVCNKIVEY